MSDLPTREDSEWTCRLVARNDPLTAAEANQVEAIIKAYVQCGTGSGHGEPLLTRAEAAADPEVVRVVREQDPLRRKIDDWAQAYPTSVFPEPDHKSTGHDPTLCSASMGRHILNTLQGYYETEATDDE